MNQELKQKKRKDRIRVTDEITAQLVSEFETSNQTVLVALKFHTYSDLAEKIRSRAMELMQETMKENQKLIKINK